MTDTFAISVRLAGMLLLRESQITLQDIEALPLVRNRQEAYAVAQKLLKAFGPTYGMKLVSDPWSSELKFQLDRASVMQQHGYEVASS